MTQASTSISAIPQDFDGNETMLSAWQDGALKPAQDGAYLRDFVEGEAISVYSQSQWRKDGFFKSDIQNAPWRGIQESHIASQ